MKISKFLKIIFVFILMFFALTINLSASTIIIERDDDSDDNTGYVFNANYLITINEDDNIGYFQRSINGNNVVLGTCEVIIIDTLNPNGYVLCNDDNNSLGTITILINSNDEEKGAIVNVNGEINTIVSVNEEVSIME